MYSTFIFLLKSLQLLAKLLKSKNPEDLQAANRLIKNMVKQVSELCFFKHVYCTILLVVVDVLFWCLHILCIFNKRNMRILHL